VKVEGEKMHKTRLFRAKRTLKRSGAMVGDSGRDGRRGQ